MKTKVLLFFVAITMFGVGYAVNAITTKNNNNNNIKVTGIGGIFFKCNNPKNITAWYKKHLGLTTNPYGATFNWYEAADSTKKAQTQWTPFAKTTKYFGATKQNFMINYRVKNLEALTAQLKKEGVTIIDKMETYDYGKFIHILDGEGNKVQLWEPTD